MPETQADPPASSRQGQIITFYSYKGGTGRTMALANVAWIMAANGKRVLAADWDLESPGLHRYFHPFLPETLVRDSSGVIDLIRQYAQYAKAAPGPDAAERLIPELARVQPHALPVNWEHFPAGGSLEFLSAGRQNLDYAASLGALDWDDFYGNLNGGEFLDAVRAGLKQHYDYVLIDSHTGLGDIAEICTMQLPDVLVDCFTLSIQGIEGAAQVASLVSERTGPDIRVLPVPMRVDQAEKDKVDAGHAVAMQLFAGLPAGMSQQQRRDYWAAVEVPYRAFYAYEETLAVFGDPPGSLTSMLASFERLTAQITDGSVAAFPPGDEHLRTRTKVLFARKMPLAGHEAVIEFCTQDQVWGEWIAEILATAGIPARERPLGSSLRAGPLTDPDSGPAITVVSAAYLSGYRARPERPEVPERVVYVTSARPPAEFYAATSVILAGLPEVEAIEQLQRLGGPGNWQAARVPGQRRIRYPGREPAINTAPATNLRFTGREDDLSALRQLLGEAEQAGPVVLQGIGGIGKTQIVIEYVHRFRTDYDLIWWLDCEQPQFIDAALADLGLRMRDHLGVAVPVTANAAEVTAGVLRLLGQGSAVARWLLVYDAAESIDAIRPYLPPGGGDIVITSRLGDWSEHARTQPVDVFTRPESIAHLRTRLPSIADSDANLVAELLGDFPLAVATAGAWLKETGTDVASYARELERRAPQALSLANLAEYPKTISETWELSFDRLAERSPAAARLFELCSVMAPNISLELLYGSTVASLLERIDPQVIDPMIIGKLVHEIDRLALIKLDPSSDQIQVHRLVQLVVRARMTADELESAERQVHEILAGARPSRGVDNPETWDRYRLLWPHLQYSRASTSTVEEVRQLVIDRLRYLWLRFDLERGREHGEEVEAVWQQMLAESADSRLNESLRRQLLQLRSAQANILRDLARFTEAMAMDESVLAEQRQLLGPEHPHTLTTAGGLAADLRALGRYGEALAMDEVTYRAWTLTYGEGHGQSLRAANNLAVSCRLTGHVATSLRLDEETLERYNASLGPLHRQTLISAFNVVRDLIEDGQYAEALARMEVLLTSVSATHGADSIEALNGAILSGIALRCAGHLASAQERFETALGLSARFGGNSTSSALLARLSSAVNLLALGRLADGEREIQAVRAVCERRLGRAHPHTLACLVDLACALRREAPDVALRSARAAADGLRTCLGRTHPHALAAMSVTAALLADAGDLGRAQDIESQVVDDLAEVLRPSHPDTLRCRANLLITRKAMNIGAASAQFDHVIAQIAEVLGSGHPHVRELTAGHRLMHTLDLQPF
jgi:tetratricopeptide (TPR) repeat protein